MQSQNRYLRDQYEELAEKLTEIEIKLADLEKLEKKDRQCQLAESALKLLQRADRMPEPSCYVYLESVREEFSAYASLDIEAPPPELLQSLQESGSKLIEAKRPGQDGAGLAGYTLAMQLVQQLRERNP